MIKAGVTVGNGAVVAANSCVVKNVPPFAIVGGNPAKVIGYRYTPEQIAKLQRIQWWYWDDEKIIENAPYFTEDVEGFCDKFYPPAQAEFEASWQEMLKEREDDVERYFMFVDYYENYPSYPFIIQSFLEHYADDRNKELILFIQEDCDTKPISEGILELLEDICMDSGAKCMLRIESGNFQYSEEVFKTCSHYIMNRTYRTVYFTCLAEQLDIKIISGADSCIQFEKTRNFIY